MNENHHNTKNNKQNDIQLYLASSSPRRQELLQQMGVSFLVIEQFVSEQHLPGELPAEFVMRLAKEKSLDGLARQHNPTKPVLGSDTVVVIDNHILGKPKEKDEAIETLLLLSGRTHQVMTAVAMSNQFKSEAKLSISQVTFAPMTQNQCELYWYSGEPADKAGSYAIQGRGALFIENINGSYSGVMGLPIFETSQLLAEFDIVLF